MFLFIQSLRTSPDCHDFSDKMESGLTITSLFPLTLWDVSHPVPWTWARSGSLGEPGLPLQGEGCWSHSAHQTPCPLKRCGKRRWWMSEEWGKNISEYLSLPLVHVISLLPCSSWGTFSLTFLFWLTNLQKPFLLHFAFSPVHCLCCLCWCRGFSRAVGFFSALEENPLVLSIHFTF